MLTSTHEYQSQDGNKCSVSEVHCGTCENKWYVITGSEFQPSYCCYCGIKFRFYDNDLGEFKLNGTPT
jgi:hypothetical protein